MTETTTQPTIHEDGRALHGGEWVRPEDYLEQDLQAGWLPTPDTIGDA